MSLCTTYPFSSRFHLFKFTAGTYSLFHHIVRYVVVDIISRVQNTRPFQCIILCDLVTRVVCVECSGNCLLISSQKPTAVSEFCTTLFFDQRCTTTSLYVHFALTLTTFRPILSTLLFKRVRFSKYPRHSKKCKLDHNTEIRSTI